MEELLDYVQKLKFDKELLRTCKVHLITNKDVAAFKDRKESPLFMLKISIASELIYDKLHMGLWNQVSVDLRRVFLILSILKANALLRDNSNDLEVLKKAVKILDIGIMMGCGLNECHLLTELTQKLHDYIAENHEIPALEINPMVSHETVNSKCDCDTSDNPSVEHFWTKYFHLHHPVKIINSISHWPALEKWKDLNYFMRTAAYRSVPVEFGRTYDDDNWSQCVVTFHEFVEKFASQSEQSPKAYLAQHDLFDQIPILRKDFAVPDYCAISSDMPVIKAWIGPENTISTMHTDDKHNLLCQVVGEKLVILAAPSESKNLYPYEGILNNTTQVDAENVNFEKFPLARNVKFLKLTLCPGEMLYIPKFYWHYVRSLSPSVSISFWFDCDE